MSVCFHSNRAQKELVEKERREELEARKKRLNHADDVRAQIREKEQVRVSERNAFFEEGVKLDEEARMRRAKLEEVKRKKLETLRYVLSKFSAIYYYLYFSIHDFTLVCSYCLLKRFKFYI